MTFHRKRGPTISLFPFLSVLAVVIGTLTMIISGISLGEIAPGPGGESRTEEYVRLRDGLAAMEEEHEQLARLAAQAEALERELEKLRILASDLESRKQASQEEQARMRELLLELERLRGRERELGEALKEVLAQLAAKRAEFETAKADAEKRRDKLLVVGGGSGSGKPRFVECTAEGLMLDSQAPPERRVMVRSADIAEAEPLVAFLRSVEGMQDGLAVFVIRPGGVRAFDAARTALATSKTPFGYMAMPGHQELDYRLFGEED